VVRARCDTHSCWPNGEGRHGIDATNGRPVQRQSKSRTRPVAMLLGRSGGSTLTVGDSSPQACLTTVCPRSKTCEIREQTHARPLADQVGSTISYRPCPFVPSAPMVGSTQELGHRHGTSHANRSGRNANETRSCTTTKFWLNYRGTTSTAKFQAWVLAPISA